MECNKAYRIILPESLNGRSIYQKVIPTVCNLKNMLTKIDAVDGAEFDLDSWEKICFKAYGIDKIKKEILHAPIERKIESIRQNIIEMKSNELKANVVDMYLVAYVSEMVGPGRMGFLNYIKEKGVTDKENAAQAIWQVGRGDGMFLGILNKDGTIKDWNFIAQWIRALNK